MTEQLSPEHQDFIPKPTPEGLFGMPGLRNLDLLKKIPGLAQAKSAVSRLKDSLVYMVGEELTDEAMPAIHDDVLAEEVFVHSEDQLFDRKL